MPVEDTWADSGEASADHHPSSANEGFRYLRKRPDSWPRDEAVDMKECTKCGIIYDMTAFHRATGRPDGRRPICKDCEKVVRRRYIKSLDPAVLKKRRAKHRRKHKYGLGEKQVFEILISQKNRCAICRVLFIGGRFSIDHCHVTGKIRGALCTSCNFGIGLFKDSIVNFRRAIKYLKAVSDDNP